MGKLTLFRRLAIVVASLALLGGLSAAPAAADEDSGKSPADLTAAAPLCWRTSCNGKDPSAMNCTGAVTRDEFPYVDIRIQLRYSSVCDAAWVRVIAPSDWTWGWAQIRAYTNSSATNLVGIRGVAATPGTHWSRMWSFTYWVRACFSAYDVTGPANLCGDVH